MNKNKFRSKYIVFAAPSGTGKTTIVKELMNNHPELALSISATTRDRRFNETDKVDYFFLSDDEFKKAIDRDEFLEYEKVHDNFYGTLIKTVEEQINSGKTVIFDVDVKGALSIKNKFKSALLIFIKPPDRETLIERLKNRKSENEQSILKRLARIDFELDQAKHFDFVVINDDLHKTLQEIEKIIKK